jgi:hypothetical protein
MKWLDWLLGRPIEDERQNDEQAIKELRASFRRVRNRTDSLEAELLRINAELKKKAARREH